MDNIKGNEKIKLNEYGDNMKKKFSEVNKSNETVYNSKQSSDCFKDNCTKNCDDFKLKIENDFINCNSISIKKEFEDLDEDEGYYSHKRSIKDEDEYIPKQIKKESHKKRKLQEKTNIPCSKKVKKEVKTVDPKKTKTSKKLENISPSKIKKEEQKVEVWKWWEEQKQSEGIKWSVLQHRGPVFAPEYIVLPKDIPFYYDGNRIQLSKDTEEVATFYAKMLDHEYTTKPIFNKNFFKDWRSVMTDEEKRLITDLKKCDFSKMHEYFKKITEEKKSLSKEEKQKIKEENQKIIDECGFCIIDGHKQRIGNFKIEPPGLFRGRGEHPKQGMLKKRVNPEDVIINCSKDDAIPKPPPGHKWKEVRHDNTVTWLASWTENIAGQTKYIMLNAASKLKGEKDWTKYEIARKLHRCVEKIRAQYREDWKSKEMRIRQRAVALYFIDKLALRAGNEKEEGETADTVGCCSLRVEHITLCEEKDGKSYVVIFDFLGKDSIRYYNEVPVEKRVFKNLQFFLENKQPGDDLFDRLTTASLNKYLNELMEGLTAKVFRTYNASFTLQDQLLKLTDPLALPAEKLLSYNRANRAVAILCNHQRAIPKTYAKSMENIKTKIENKRKEVTDAEKEYKIAKKSAKGSQKEKVLVDKKKRLFERLQEQLTKLEVLATDKEENKEIALSTSKLNYLDPRISVAWCKKHNVPIEKIYNKTQREKFQWAIDMAGADFFF